MSAYDAYINEAAAKYGLDPNLIRQVIRAESGGNANAGSPAGARGLMQLMPGTARGLGVTNILDPRQNIMGGSKYLRQQLDAFGGSIPKALAAYNAGPGAVTKYGGIPPFTETQNYVKKIMGWLGGGDTAVLNAPAGAQGQAMQAPAAMLSGPSPSDAIAALRASRPTMRQLGVGKGKVGPLDQQAAASRLAALTQLKQAMNSTGVPPSGTASSDVTGGAGTIPLAAGGMVSGLDWLKAAKLIGTPNAGTHTLGNWQSDNALDIAFKSDTPLYATEGGVVGSRFGSLNSSNPRMAGLRMSIDGDNRSWYYAHLSRFAPGIKPGVRVRQGQLIGYSGTANGVDHLHLGVSQGDPRKLLGL